MLSTAGSILGGLARRASIARRHARVDPRQGRQRGRAAHPHGRRRRPLDAAENKVEVLHRATARDLEAELAEEVTDIDAKWMAMAKQITTLPVGLERTDVKVTQLALVWIPVPT